jgi:lysophospholipase L1-like esterase
MFGHGVKLRDTYLKILERKLNQMNSSLNYEVINFAVPGYNAAMEVEVFEKKALKYNPDLIIVGFCGNDGNLPNFIKRPQSYKTLRKSMFIDFVLKKIINLPVSGYFGLDNKDLSKDLERVPFANYNPIGDSNLVPREYRYMVGWKGYSNAMKHLSKLAKENNIEVIQTAHRIEKNNLTILWKDLGFYYIPFPWNFTTRIKNKSLIVSESNHHPSALAHKLIAEKCYNGLINNNLVPLIHRKG